MVPPLAVECQRTVRSAGNQRMDESEIGGAKRDRTADLLVANEALSQLSYSPTRREQPNIILTVNRANADNSQLSPAGPQAPLKSVVQMDAGNLTLRHSGRSPAP